MTKKLDIERAREWLRDVDALARMVTDPDYALRRSLSITSRADRIPAGGVKQILSAVIRERLNVMGHKMTALRAALTRYNEVTGS